MTIEKLDSATPDLTQQNIERLLKLFPECRTEGSRDDAPMVDFDLLRQALSDHLVEGPSERYRLDWPGKRQALLTANTPIDKTLRPMREESVDFDTTRNLFIEGDNLDALKLLQETYLGKVKMIYIDPPYNTGNDFVYRDDFTSSRDDYEAESGERSDAEGRLVANPLSQGRFHSNWLSMIYSRLKLAKNLLAEDGIIFISIDDNERANLERVCREIFGDEQFISALVWKARVSEDTRAMTGVSQDHEYILAIAKSSTGSLRGVEKDLAKFSNKDDDVRGPWRSADMTGLATKDQRPNLHYDLTNPETGVTYPCPPKGWRFDKDTMAKRIAEKKVLWPDSADGRPRQKLFLKDIDNPYKNGSSVLSGFSTSMGTREVNGLLGQSAFDFPKPRALVQFLVQQATSDDEVVLDFFAGSGTTAEAVLCQNAEDNGRRSFICVQLPEQIEEGTASFQLGFSNISKLAQERIRRAASKLLKHEPSLKGKLDFGFRAFRIDSGNFQNTTVTAKEATQASLAGMVDHIKDDRTDEDLLFGALLRWGVDITLPVEQRELAGRKVWFVDPAEDGSGRGAALIACFERPKSSKGGIDTTLADAMAELAPLRALFRDDGFADDATKENVHSRFQQRAPDTQVRVL